MVSRIRLRRLMPVVALIALVGAVGIAPGAQGTILERQHFTDSYDDTNWDCGHPIQVVGEARHLIQIREAPKSDAYIFFSDQYTVSETWTAADGRWFTLTANGLTKDVRAHRIGDNEYEFTFMQAGQPAVITDSSGSVVARDRGSVTFSYTVNFADGSFEFLGARIAGPHPAFDTDLCLLTAPLVGNDSATRHTARPLGSTAAGMGYYEYLPPTYSATGVASPLLVATNGYGENGDGSAEQLDNLLFTGIPRFINVGGWPTDRPLVVLSTQHIEDPPGFDFGPCDGVDPWGGSCAMMVQHERDHASPAFCTTPEEIHAFISYAVAHYNVDPGRVYLTGLSCGGFGAWEYVAKYRDEQVAAAVPIAAEGRPAWSTAGCALAAVPLWAFHGEQDDTINPLGSVEPITNVRTCPGVDPDSARLTTYPDLSHDGWNQAYSGSRGEDIYGWMLGFSKP